MMNSTCSPQVIVQGAWIVDLLASKHMKLISCSLWSCQCLLLDFITTVEGTNSEAILRSVQALAPSIKEHLRGREGLLGFKYRWIWTPLSWMRASSWVCLSICTFKFCIKKIKNTAWARKLLMSTKGYLQAQISGYISEQFWSLLVLYF